MLPVVSCQLSVASLRSEVARLKSQIAVYPYLGAADFCLDCDR